VQKEEFVILSAAKNLITDLSLRAVWLRVMMFM